MRKDYYTNMFIEGFSPNLHWPKDSNGSRRAKEGSCEQVALTQSDRSDTSHHSIHLRHRELALS